jgi:hypothetical protein
MPLPLSSGIASIRCRQNQLLRRKELARTLEASDDSQKHLMIRETFLRIRLSLALCECRTGFDILGHLRCCERHRRQDLYIPGFPRPTFPSGKLVIDTESADNDKPPPLMADSDEEFSPHGSSDYDPDNVGI